VGKPFREVLRRGQNNIKMNFRETGSEDEKWMELVQDMD
jgi:hypothetical protein